MELFEDENKQFTDEQKEKAKKSVNKIVNFVKKYPKEIIIAVNLMHEEERNEFIKEERN